MFVSLGESAALGPAPSPRTARTTPSRPLISRYPPGVAFSVAAASDSASHASDSESRSRKEEVRGACTAHSPVATHGGVIRRTAWQLRRTSHTTTRPSEPALARRFPHGRNAVAVASAFGWLATDATAVALLALPSSPQSFTVPSLHADASKPRAPPSPLRLNRKPGSQRSGFLFDAGPETVSSGEPSGSFAARKGGTRATSTAASRSHRRRSVPAAVASIGPPPSPSPTNEHPYTSPGWGPSTSTRATAASSGSCADAARSAPDGATFHTATAPSADPEARMRIVGCHATRTTSSLWPRHTP
mmetsp:Transcript_1759/g.7253  ORF Transcript_1759/g.7253 Transcript_1759/m.7253 type:complete len:303 (+) Transcript_1759:401-1309(+)